MEFKGNHSVITPEGVFIIGTYDDYSDKKITPKSLMECPSLRYFSQKPFGVIFLYIMLPKTAKLLIA